MSILIPFVAIVSLNVMFVVLLSAVIVALNNVLTAMSVVPDAVRLLRKQSKAMYLDINDVANPTTNGGRALTRPQIELIAGRVSALNDCFY